MTWKASSKAMLKTSLKPMNRQKIAVDASQLRSKYMNVIVACHQFPNGAASIVIPRGDDGPVTEATVCIRLPDRVCTKLPRTRLPVYTLPYRALSLLLRMKRSCRSIT